MGDSDQILKQLLFRGKLLRVHDDELALMGFTQVGEQIYPNRAKRSL